MAGTWPKVILDPIHELIQFEDNDCDRLLLDLINTKEFQRLRRIKQLGMSELVFPGTNHSRFSHSIGVMHVARTILDRTQNVLNVKFDQDQRMAACSAALLHDIGHGPFSHAFEKVTKQKHEPRTVEILKSAQTDVNSVLVARNRSLPDRVAMFIEPTPETAWREAGLPPFVARIVSSQLDDNLWTL
jgi:HD superfamily phosphohydrolase